jgi:acetylcholinesterase
MGGVFFLKAGGWQTVAVHSKHNPRAYWYSYEFHNVPEISILPLEPPIPTGKTRSVLLD